MSRRLWSLGLFGLLGLVGVFGAASSSSAASPPTWGTAIEMPGSAALGPDVGMGGVTCPTPGNCVAGDDYRDSSGHVQVFLVEETNGVWGSGFEVPGIGVLNTGGSAYVSSISCPSAGNCAAGGSYRVDSTKRQPFVVDETNGVWGTAIQVPGMATLNTGTSIYGDNSGTSSVSCPTAGNCTASGTYIDSSGSIQPFIATETNGTWATAIVVPGLGALNSGGYADLGLDCPSVGNCTGGGSYSDGSKTHAYVVTETNGSWGTALEVPGTATLNTGGNAAVADISCTSAGNCGVGGNYMTTAGKAAGQYNAFVVAETNGSWGTATQVPGTAAFNSHGYARLESVSCGAAGNCTADGYYSDSAGHTQAFVVDQTNGSWGSAIEVPGTAFLNNGGSAIPWGLSCAAARTCTTGGYYTDASGKAHAFVADETDGSWGTAIEVPGTATLSGGNGAETTGVSCPTAGNCAAVGGYPDASGHFHAFVVDSTTNGTAAATALVAASASGEFGGTTTLSATLTSGGNGVPGETVSFFLAGLSVGNATTDANGVATLPTASLAGIAAGSYPSGVTAYFAGDDTYQASIGTNSLTLPKLAQAIVITTHAPANTHEDAVFTVAATGGGSGNPIVYGSAGACTNTGTRYVLTGGGVCTVTYDQTGGFSYNAAPQLTESVVVAAWTALTVGTAVATYGGTTTLSATLTSDVSVVPGKTLTFTLNGTSVGSAVTDANGVARLPNVSAAGIAVGLAPITASFAGDANYTQYHNATGSLSVNKAAQTIVISTHAPASASVGDQFVVAATGGGSGNAIAYGSSGSCTNTGATYTMTGGGQCTVTYNEAGNTNYNAAPQLTETVNGSKADQTIHITTDAPPSAAYGTGFTVAATGGGSGNVITYGSAGGCTNSGGQFTMTSGSTDCTVTYDEAGDADYNAASQQSETVTAQKADQTIDVTIDAPSNAAYQSSFDVDANAPGGAVAFAGAGQCSNVASHFTMTSGGGTCTVTFDQAGGSNYNAATEVSELVVAAKASQSITFATPAGHTYGDANVDPGATASSGNSVSYGASGACAIVGGHVHITGAGSCAVRADQAGDANYNAALQVQRTFSVGKAALSITASDRAKYVAQTVMLGSKAFSSSGLVGSDSVSRVTLTSSGAGAGAASGNYAIAPSGAVAGPGTSLGNYTVTYHGGMLQVRAVGIIGLSGVSVAMSGGKIDSFDSSAGAYGLSNHGGAALVMSNGALSFSGVSLLGSAISTAGSVSVAHTASASGNVTAGTTASVLGTVGGTVVQHARGSALSGTVSACSPYSGKAGISGGTHTYSSGNLTVKSGTVKLANGTYCFRNVSLAAGSTLSVSGPVAIHLTGTLLGKGHIVNKTDQTVNLHIETAFAGANGVAIVGDGDAYMSILAPRTSVAISSGSFFGTLLAGTVRLSGGSAFHADVH